MDKINFENAPSTNTPLSAEILNQMQANIEEIGAVVSATEPTTNEKVWFKKGKNLFDKNNANVLNAYIEGGTTTITSHANNRLLYIPCKPNTTYTVQKYKSEVFAVGYTNETPNINVQSYGGIHGTRGSYDGTIVTLTLTTGDNAKYLVVRYYNSVEAANVTEQEMLNSIQIEQGTATDYEPYVEKAIYTKNANGVFEPFTDNIETITNSYSTAIKYPDGTMICTQKHQVTEDITTAWGSLYISDIIRDESFPIPFIKPPVVTRTIFAPSGTQAVLIPSEGEGTPTTTNAGTYSLLRPTSREGVIMEVDTTAIGRWK